METKYQQVKWGMGGGRGIASAGADNRLVLRRVVLDCD